MPSIVRKPISSIMETRRDILLAASWEVHSSIWKPPTDVYETDVKLIVKVEVAGMREDDFEVAVEDQVLMITGNRPGQNERRAYHQMEIRSGKFEIAVALPPGVDLEQAAAEYKEGFLIVVFPKIQAKQIEVE